MVLLSISYLSGFGEYSLLVNPWRTGDVREKWTWWVQLLRFSDCYFRLVYNRAYPDRPSVHFSPSCFIQSYLDHKHKQHGAKERKELHFQSAFRVLMVVLGVTPKAILFQPLKEPNEMGRDCKLQHRVEEIEARRRRSTLWGVPRFPLRRAHSLCYCNRSLKCLLRSFWERCFWILKNITFTNDLVIVFIASQWSVKCSKRQHWTISFDGEVFQRMITPPFWAPDALTLEFRVILNWCWVAGLGTLTSYRDWRESLLCLVFILKH